MRIGVGFLGAGIVAEMHGRAVAANSNAKLVNVCDREIARATSLAKKFGGKVSGNLQEVLEDPQVNAVHILTPPDSHVEAALASLKAGKHVLVEKPVAWKAADKGTPQLMIRFHEKLRSGMPKDEAEKIKAQLEKAGAKVELK